MYSTVTVTYCEIYLKVAKRVDFKSSHCVVCVNVRLFATPRAVDRQASLSMGFSRQEYWSGLPFPSPEDVSDPGIEPWSPALQADSLPFELQGNPEQVLTWIATVAWSLT